MHPWFSGDRVYTINGMMRWVSSNLQHYVRGYTGNIPLSRAHTRWNPGKKAGFGCQTPDGLISLPCSFIRVVP